MQRSSTSDQPPERRVKRLKRFSILRLLLLLTVYGGFLSAGFTYYVYATLVTDLPDVSGLLEPPSKATRVYSADGQLIGEFFLERRVVVELDRIPTHVRQAFVAAEDGRFWEHPGFDPLGIARAAIANYRGTGSKQGASTITQQLARLVLLTPERTYYRKMRELLLAVLIDRRFSKRQVLEMYLNRVYLGHGAHGIQAAAENYYGKDVEHLTLAEAALLAGLVQRPTDYSPLNNLAAARSRQAYVLDRMLKDGYVSASQAEEAVNEPLTLVGDDVPLNHLAAPYFVEYVRQWASKRYGHNKVFYGGLRLYTTLDTRMQRSAEAAVRDGLEDLDRRIGFRGPLGSIETDALATFQAEPPRPYLPGLDSVTLTGDADLLPDVAYVGAVVDLSSHGRVRVAVGDRQWPMDELDSRRLVNWRGDPDERPRRQLRVGDLIPVRVGVDKRDHEVLQLAQVPDVQGALVAMVPATGAVRAMVGGLDFRTNQFNRAVQANRQIGSAFKPIIYATALSRGVTHVDKLSDSPVAVRTATGVWTPSNYDGKYLGTITLRTALAKSINTISVRLTLKVGVDAVIEMARALGVQSPITRHISIALGTPDLTLLEVTSAYSAFANGGKRVPPQDDEAMTPPGRFVDLVTRDDGTIVEDFRERVPTQQAIDPALAYLMVDLMKATVERGTGRKAQELGRPAAGKTGTSTEWRDAWFIGYTVDLIAGVWVGRDDFTPIGARATGGGAALPIWLQFMQASHPDTPVTDFPIPDNVVLVRANELSGEPAAPGSTTARLIPFARGTVPHRFRPSARPERFGRADDFAAP